MNWFAIWCQNVDDPRYPPVVTYSGQSGEDMEVHGDRYGRPRNPESLLEHATDVEVNLCHVFSNQRSDDVVVTGQSMYAGLNYFHRGVSVATSPSLEVRQRFCRS